MHFPIREIACLLYVFSTVVLDAGCSGRALRSGERNGYVHLNWPPASCFDESAEVERELLAELELATTNVVKRLSNSKGPRSLS